MDTFWKSIIGRQFGAAIDMLENAIRACPEEVWCEPSVPPAWKDRDVVGFWYVAYHTLFFLDFYLSDPAHPFQPPQPFTLDELDPAGLLPERPFTKAELQAYVDHCRTRFDNMLATLTNEKAHEPYAFGSLQCTTAEALLYQMRHVQHHAAQLNLLLRQRVGAVPPYVKHA